MAASSAITEHPIDEEAGPLRRCVVSNRRMPKTELVIAKLPTMQKSRMTGINNAGKALAVIFGSLRRGTGSSIANSRFVEM